MIPLPKPTSLRQRTILYILAPTLLILLVSGYIGFQMAKDIILTEWTSNANSHLKNAANQIDRRLEQPKQLLMLLQEAPTGRRGATTHQFIIKQIEKIPGVMSVKVDWPALNHDPALFFPAPHKANILTRYSSKMDNLQQTKPEYEPTLKKQTIVLTSEYKDIDDVVVGKIEVTISFMDLIGEIAKESWWVDNRSFIIDKDGHTLGESNTSIYQQISEHSVNDHAVIDQNAWAEIQGKRLGTIFGKGQPPKEVCVFYQLDQAPWTLVVVAPGDRVLRSLFQFRNIYLSITFGAALFIILTIYLLTSRVNHDINLVSEAAAKLAEGHFGPPLPITSKDEIGKLNYNFNTMTQQLQEGVQLQKSMQIAREVQQTLLPKNIYSKNEIEIAGTSIYCDETGGDYYDILDFLPDHNSVAIVVGDVVGHGIGAALLMATTRALLRSRISIAGSPSTVISDVNTLLCQDTVQANNFVTLFLMEINHQNKSFTWVRAGHEAAIAYNISRGTFSEIIGTGVALGVDEKFKYQEQTLSFAGEKQIILVGSDGVWDAENEDGEQFGKDRVKKLIAEAAHLAPKQIISTITDAILTFQGTANQVDDITLVIIKTSAEGAAV